MQPARAFQIHAITPILLLNGDFHQLTSIQATCACCGSKSVMADGHCQGAEGSNTVITCPACGARAAVGKQELWTWWVDHHRREKLLAQFAPPVAPAI